MIYSTTPTKQCSLRIHVSPFSLVSSNVFIVPNAMFNHAMYFGPFKCLKILPISYLYDICNVNFCFFQNFGHSL